MFPVLLHIGKFKLYGYGVFVSLGFVLGILYGWREAKRVGVDQQKILDLAFWVLVFGIVGARILFILTMWRDYLRFPWEIFMVWKGGLVHYGGILGGLFAALWYIRKSGLPMLKTLDILGAVLVVGEVSGRIGCLSAGCCYGSPTDLPWGITFTDPQCLVDVRFHGIPLHPSQIYAALAALAIFLFLQFFKTRASFPGQVGFTGLLLYAAARFGLEYLRGDDIRGYVWQPYLTTSQFISIPVILTCVGVLLYLRRLHRLTPAPQPADV